MKILITENQYYKVIKKFVDNELSKLKKTKFQDFPNSIFYCRPNFDPNDITFNDVNFQYTPSNKTLYFNGTQLSEMFPGQKEIIKKYVGNWVRENFPYPVIDLRYH